VPFARWGDVRKSRKNVAWVSVNAGTMFFMVQSASIVGELVVEKGVAVIPEFLDEGG